MLNFHLKNASNIPSTPNIQTKIISIAGWGYQKISQNLLKKVLNVDVSKYQRAIINLKSNQKYVILTHSYGLFRFLDFLQNLKKIQSFIENNKTNDLNFNYFHNFIDKIDRIYILNGFLHLQHHENALAKMLINLQKKRWLPTLNHFYQLCEKNSYVNQGLTKKISDDYENTKIIHAYQNANLSYKLIIEYTLQNELQNMFNLYEKQELYLPLLQMLTPMSCYIHGEYDAIVGGSATQYGGLAAIKAQRLILPTGHFI